MEGWWKDRKTACLLIHVRDNSIVAAEEKCLGPGCILRNEPTGFLDRLDMEEDIKDRTSRIGQMFFITEMGRTGEQFYRAHMWMC